MAHGKTALSPYPQPVGLPRQLRMAPLFPPYPSMSLSRLTRPTFAPLRRLNQSLSHPSRRMPSRLTLHHNMGPRRCRAHCLPTSRFANPRSRHGLHPATTSPVPTHATVPCP